MGKTYSNLEALKVHAIKQEDKIKHLTIKFKTLHKKLELHNISTRMIKNEATKEISNNMQKDTNCEESTRIKQLEFDKEVLKRKVGLIHVLKINSTLAVYTI